MLDRPHVGSGEAARLEGRAGSGWGHMGTLMKIRYARPVGNVVLSSFLALALSFVAGPAISQHGHPLVGTWSGDLTGGEQNVRVLIALEFNVDQTITGFMMANGSRLPLTSASLDPSSWEVTLSAGGQDRAGRDVSYDLQGTIENLGSTTERAIVGTWREGSHGGEFRVVRNH